MGFISDPKIGRVFVRLGVVGTKSLLMRFGPALDPSALTADPPALGKPPGGAMFTPVLARAGAAAGGGGGGGGGGRLPRGRSRRRRGRGGAGDGNRLRRRARRGRRRGGGRHVHGGRGEVVLQTLVFQAKSLAEQGRIGVKVSGRLGRSRRHFACFGRRSFQKAQKTFAV